MEKLLPCPFCGGEATVSKHFKEDMWRLIHRCKTMGFIEIDWRMSPEWLAKQWNTRSSVERGTVDMEKDNRASADQFMQLVAQNTPLTGEPYYALRDILVMMYEARQAKAVAQLPTPDLTARIEAAAEEIDRIYVQADGVTMPVSDIAAILKRHLEGGK